MNQKSSLFFILINILVAAIGFLRSFVFLDFFDFKDLGIITIINTSTVLIGFFQLGLINGGYRIIALQDETKSERAKNLIFTYFIFLFIFLFIGSIVFYLYKSEYELGIITSMVCLGLLALINNWVTNSLIGIGNYRLLNIASFFSAVLSISFAFLSYRYGIYGALISLLSQPFSFILVVFFIDRKQIPTKFYFDIKFYKEILSYGFVPFLTSIFFLIYMQIERWGINYFLGKESLGKLFLFFIICNLWVLVPTSILNLFYPKAIKLLSDNKIIEFNKIMKQNSLLVLIYSLIGSVVILILFQPLVNYFFPTHIEYSQYVLFALPGLVFRSFSDPLSLYFNSVLNLKFIFWSDILSLIIYIFSLFVFYLNADFTLKHFIYCFNIYFVSKFFILLIPYLKIKSSFDEKNRQIYL